MEAILAGAFRVQMRFVGLERGFVRVVGIVGVVGVVRVVGDA